MNYYFYIFIGLFIIVSVIVADELAYTYWKRTNRGEHWSHLQFEDRPMTLVTWPWQLP